MNLGTLALQSGSESSEPVNLSRRETGKFNSLGQSFSVREGSLRFEERSLMMRNRLLQHLSKAELHVTMGCGRMRHRLERMKD